MPLTLPSEIIDTIIDAVALQGRPSLGSCARVSSSWLPRARFHLFSSLRLTPSRIATFIPLLEGSTSTLAGFIRHVELDGNLRPPTCCRGNDDALLEQMAFFATVHRDTQALMQALVALTGASANLQLASLTLCNIDFTLIPPKQLEQITQQLASSTFAWTLDHIAFTDVSFQSLKQSQALIHLFPKIQRVTFGKKVAFLRLRHTACEEAAHLPWKKGVEAIHIEAEEEHNISETILSWIASPPESDEQSSRSLRNLTINGLSEKDLEVLLRAIEHVAPHLRNLELKANHSVTAETRDAIFQAVSSSPTCQVHLCSIPPSRPGDSEPRL